MKRFFGTFLLVGTFMLGLQGTVFARFLDDADIPDWAIREVETVQEVKIMTGFGDGTFRPDKLLNRAEALTLLLRTKGIDPKDILAEDGIFPDVKKEDWFASAVKEGVDRGWIKGADDGYFYPGNSVNKAEWSIMLMRAFNMASDRPLTGFRDVPARVWFASAVNALDYNDLIRDRDDDFEPDSLVTRADAAWMIARILDKPRLMGTSSENEFDDSQQMDSRRVAIKPRDFDANKQGYDIEKEALIATAVPAEGDLSLNISDDWLKVGVLNIKNGMENRADVDSLQIRLRFEEDNVGPEGNFKLKLVAGDLIREMEANSSGEFFIPFDKLEARIPADETLSFDVFVKPREDYSYFTKDGTFRVAVFILEGSTIEVFQSENVDGMQQKNAPVDYETRDFASVRFRPIK